MSATMTFGAPVEQDRFSKYFGMAVGAHVVLIAALAFMPDSWIARQEPEEDIMRISLGGVPGPRLTGLNSISDRPVQEATPEPVRPQYQAPAEKPATMAIPDKAPPKPVPTPATKTPIQTTTEKPVSRTPIRGAEVREGQARVDTRTQSIGTGLSIGGGELGTGGETNLSNFCCPQYIKDMIDAVYRNWKQNQGVEGKNVVRFTIERDGRVTGVELVTPSNLYALDRESRVALMNKRMPALPREFTEPRLTVRLIFEYKR
jgi:TonB family protein